MNTNTVVSVVDISGNIITKTATRRTNKGNWTAKKNKEHDKAYWQEYYQNNSDKINEKKAEYNKDYCKQLEMFCVYCQCKWKNVGGLDIYKQRSISIMKRWKMMKKR